MPETRKRFWTLGLVALVVAGAVAVLIAGFVSWFFIEVGACSGDGGVPYAALDSPKRDVCGTVLPSIPIWGSLIVLIVGILAAAILRSRRAIVVTFVVSVMLVLIPAAIVSSLSGNCPDDHPDPKGERCQRY